MTIHSKTILEIALPCPLRKTFDYLATAETANTKNGSRALVPFGPRKIVGIVVGRKTSSDIDQSKLKHVIKAIDSTPLFDDKLFALCRWAADYYHHPIGEVFATALPKLLRSDHPAEMNSETNFELTEEGKEVDLSTIARATAQVKLLTLLRNQHIMSKTQLHEAGVTLATIKALLKKSWLLETKKTILPATNHSPQPALTLNDQQNLTVQAIKKTYDTFAVSLIYGITGSGKTEVYFQAMQPVLDQGKQVLVLIPEISLTPQTISRFKNRFRQPVVALHSGLNDKERQNAWLLAKHDKTKIIIGTRSAIFTPLANPSMIIIDEEHDASFKQQESFRYHARDLAIVRASKLKIPVVLGSATPSLESLRNVEDNKYQLLTLNKRAGGATPPEFKVVSLKNLLPDEHFSRETTDEIKKHLAKDQQVLIFINRRGYAPVLFCQSCEWVPECKRCDSKMVIHKHQRRLHCHHCGAHMHLPHACPECQSESLLAIGQGTQRLEESLNAAFPNTPITRFDRDSTRGKDKFDTLLKKIHEGGRQILVGTQMLAKGHHFPNVTLVVILDIDGGFLSSDFRAPERTGQLLMQVAGRAGREEKKGLVLIQTHQPDNELLKILTQENYHAYAEELLNQRKLCHLPPFGYLCLIRAEAKQAHKAMQFLEAVRELLPHADVQCLGPVAAPMQKKAGFFRAQLLLQSSQRAALHNALKRLLPQIDNIPLAKQTRWNVDVDPLDLS